MMTLNFEAVKSVSTRVRAVVLFAISPISSVYPKTQKDKVVSVLVFSGWR